MPISGAESVEVGKGTVTKPITLTVGGESHVLEAPRALPRALEPARGTTAV